MSMDLYNLERFVEAQAPVYEEVCAELRAGRKRSHWMWFVFPQIAWLGGSAMAVRYAISSREEDAAYLAHPLFTPRQNQRSRSSEYAPPPNQSVPGGPLHGEGAGDD